MFSAHILVGLTALTLLIYAAWTDIQTRLISNSTTALLLLCYGVAVLTSPAPMAVLSGIGMAALTFTLGFALWHFGLLGGGDVKLLSVLALWAGFTYGIELLVITTLAGGVLVLIQSGMASRSVKRMVPGLASAGPAFDSTGDHRSVDDQNTRAELTNGSPVQLPYGVAIACGGAWVLFKQFGA